MNTIDCLPRETLKRYLAGWMDMPQSVEIEQHLSECQACEQTIIDLEVSPDTLLETVQTSKLRSDDSPADHAVLGPAVERVKQLVAAREDSAGPSPVEVSRTLGMYELIRLIGRGGMGAVYLARHRALGKPVAIKILPDSSSIRGEVAARFQREIRAAGKLNHPAIVAATDAGEENGTHYLVMEFIDGMDLSRLARWTGPWNIADACEVVRQVALGLSYAHSEGIVHRDIKPSNLVVDSEGRVKILDFGLAQICLWDEASAELTSVGQLMGTLDYMAPEQAERSGSVDYRADLYSLGATLFRLLCGRALLAAAPNMSLLDKLRLLAAHQPLKLDTLRSDAPQVLVELVSQLLAKEPELRPASAAHVAERLAPLAQGANLANLLSHARSVEVQADVSPHRSDFFSDFPVSPPPKGETFQQPSRFHRSWKWLAAASLSAFVLVAGVLIVLETQKGQLIIQSDVSDVRIKLLRDGRPVHDMQLENGVNSTRLVADKYEIIIESPSDAITIVNSRFDLKRGDVVIARIEEKTAARVESPLADVNVGQPPGRKAWQAAKSADSSLDLGTAAPIYDGRTLDDWLVQLSRERSPSGINESMTAIYAMTNTGTADRIRPVLLEVWPSLDDSYDSRVFDILHKTVADKGYYELLVQILDQPPGAMIDRVFMVGAYRYRGKTVADIEPLLAWVSKNLLLANDVDADKRRLIEPAAEWCLNLLIDQTSGIATRAVEERVLPMMEKSSHVGIDFWMSHEPQPHWPNRLRELVISRAARAVTDEETPAPEVTVACMILDDELRSKWESSGVDWREIQRAVQTRLISLSENPMRMYQPVDVPTDFGTRTRPHHSGVSLSGGSGVGSGGRTIQAYEIIELLDLAADLRSEKRLGVEVREVLEATANDFEKVSPAALSPDKIDVAVNWPRLNDGRGMFHKSPHNVDFQPQEWLGFQIHYSALQVAGRPVSTPNTPNTPDSDATNPFRPANEKKP